MRPTDRRRGLEKRVRVDGANLGKAVASFAKERSGTLPINISAFISLIFCFGRNWARRLARGEASVTKAGANAPANVREVDFRVVRFCFGSLGPLPEKPRAAQ